MLLEYWGGGISPLILLEYPGGGMVVVLAQVLKGRSALHSLPLRAAPNSFLEPRVFLHLIAFGVEGLFWV